MLDRWLLAHPRSVGESYFEHQRIALGFAASLLRAAAACFLHALVPSLFERTASRTITDLHERMVRSRAQQRGCREAGAINSAVISASPSLQSAGASPRSDP